MSLKSVAFSGLSVPNTGIASNPPTIRAASVAFGEDAPAKKEKKTKKKKGEKKEEKK
jgi:hypothetical protein